MRWIAGARSSGTRSTVSTTNLAAGGGVFDFMYIRVDNGSQMRHGQGHLVSTFFLPIFVLLSLGTPGWLIHCIGSDGHQGIELAGVPCTSKTIQTTAIAGIAEALPLLFDSESCVDIPIPTITPCLAAQRSAVELATFPATFTSAAIAFPDLSLAAGLMPTTPSGQLPPALPRASLRTVILLV
ncbi:MAG: hypothetical protein ACYC26_15845 [Phycisphaerales bacterium]